MRVPPEVQREFLLDAATWQDSLLQSYRTLHVTIQALLIAAGAAVLAVQLTAAVQGIPSDGRNALSNVLFTGLLAWLCWLQWRTASELKSVVASRAADVDHWHCLVILGENQLDPEQRAFTYFKRWQQAKRQDLEHIESDPALQRELTPTEAQALIGKGTGHTRKVVDANLFNRMQALWVAIMVVTSLITVWFLTAWLIARCT